MPFDFDMAEDLRDQVLEGSRAAWISAVLFHFNHHRYFQTLLNASDPDDVINDSELATQGDPEPIPPPILPPAGTQEERDDRDHLIEQRKDWIREGLKVLVRARYVDYSTSTRKYQLSDTQAELFAREGPYRFNLLDSASIGHVLKAPDNESGDPGDGGRLGV